MAIDKTYVDLELRTNGAEKTVKDLRADLKQLQKEGNQQINIKLNIEKELAKIEQTKQAIVDLKSQLQTLQNGQSVLKGQVSQFNEYQRQLRSIKQEINQVQNAITQLQSKRLTSSLTKDEKKELRELQAQLKELTQQKRNIELKLEIDGLTEAKKNFDSLQKDIQKVQGKIAKAQVVIDGEEKARNDLNQVESNIDDINDKKAEIRVEIEDAKESSLQMTRLRTQANELDGKTIDMKVRIQQVGTSLSNIGSTMNNAGRRMLDWGNNGNNPIGAFGHFLKQGVLYGGMYRVTSNFMNVIGNSFSGAINRMDTIANAQRTFQAMDFDDSVVQSSIDDLENRILGLPTTLNDAMKQVMMISSINNDLPQSVRIFDAFNNAILAFGGSSEQANRAITQFSQAMGTGKIDARTYLSLTDAGMSPALAKVAEMLGYSSENMGEFKSALGEGEISIEEFTNALITLNESGYDTMKALNSLAKENALKSIGSSITVAETQIQKGWQSIIQTINDTLENAGYGSIPQNIANFGEFIESQMTRLSDYINNNQDDVIGYIHKIVGAIQDLIDTAKQFDFKSAFEGFKSIFPVDFIVSNIGTLKDIIQGLLQVLGGGDVSKGIGRFIGLSYSLRMFGKMTSGIGTILTATAGPLASFLSIIEKFGSKKTDSGVFGKMSSFVDTVKGANTAKQSVSGVSSVPTSSFNMDSFKTNTANLATRAGNLALIAGVAGTVMLYAEAIQQVDEKIPDDIGNVSAKLIALGTTASVFTGLLTAFTKLSESSNIELGSQLASLATLALGAGDIILFAEAMKQVDEKVPDNLADVAEKFTNMLVVISAFMGFSAGLGALMTQGSGLVLVFTMLGEVVGIISGLALWAMVATFEKSIEGLEEICNAMDRIADIDINSGDVLSNLEKVYDVTESMSEYAGDIFTGLGKIINLKLDQGVFAQASSNITQLVELVKLINELSGFEISQDNVSSALKAINETINTMNSNNITLITWDGEAVTSNAEKLKNLSQILEALSSISQYDATKISTGNITSALKAVKDSLTEFKDFKFPTIEQGLTAENAENISGFIGNVNSILEGLTNLKVPEGYSIDNVGKVLRTLYKAMKYLRYNNFNTGKNKDWNKETIFSMFNGYEIDPTSVQNVTDSVNKMGELINAFANMPEPISEKNAKKYKDTFKSIADMLKAIVTPSSGYDKSLSQYIDEISEYKDSFSTLVGEGGIISSLAQVTKNFSEMQANLEGVKLEEGSPIFEMVTQLKEFMKKFKEKDFTDVIQNEDIATNVKNISDTVSSLATANEQLVAIQGTPFNIDSVNQIITNLQTLLSNVSALRGAEEASSMITTIQFIIIQVQTMLQTLSGMNEQFATTGTGWAESLNTGFSDYGLSEKFVAIINDVKANLENISFSSVGQHYATTLNSGFSSHLNLGNAISLAVSGLNGYTSSFSLLGSSFGNALADAFNEETSGLSVNVTTNTSGKVEEADNNYKGGYIKPRYYSNGGKVYRFVPRGTDTVPSMLTKGEYVIRKEAVDKVGIPFLDKINGMNLREAYRDLMISKSESFTTSRVSNVINNTTNYNNRTVNVSGGKERTQRQKANRFMRELAV